MTLATGINYLLDDTDLTTYRRYEELPDEVVDDYSTPTAGVGLCATAIAQLVASGGATLAAALDLIAPRTAELVRASPAGYFVDVRFRSEPASPFVLYFVVPLYTANVALKLHSAYEGANEDGRQHACKNLRGEFLPLLRICSQMLLHVRDPANLEIGDVFLRFPPESTRVKEFAKGRRAAELKRLFGDISTLRTLAYDHEQQWFVFFDDGERGDQALWLATSNWSRVVRLMSPLAAIDSILLHYLAGRANPFEPMSL